MKLDPGGNSGVCFRSGFELVAAGPDPGLRLPPGYEADVNDTPKQAAKTGTLWQIGPGAGPVVLVREPPAPAGEWMTLDVIAVGGRITVQVNGKTTADWTDGGAGRRSGHIALQVNWPETTVVRFRKIEIKELPAGPPPAAAGPFVLVGPAGRAGTAFATLAEAVAAAPAGGAVEVRGNGPFVTAGVVAERAVTIRAGAGFRPVLEHDPNDQLNGALLVGANGLTLEGLELRSIGAPPGMRRILVNVAAGPFAAANCRFVTAGALTRTVGAPRVDLRNCEFLSAWAQAGAVNWSDPPSKGTLRMTNCVSPSWALFLHPSQTELADVRVEFRDNTFVGAYLMSYYSGGELLGDGKRPPPFRITASDNVLQVPSLFRVEINPSRAAATDWPLDRVDRLARAALDWKGDRNVYLPTTGYELWHGNEAGKMGRVVKPRAAWKAGWGAGDAGGVEAEVRFRSPLRQKAADGPHLLTPEDFRLADDSPGRKAGPGGKDLGADIDLVGPGDAYERWKKTPEYREWTEAGSGGQKQ